MEFVPERPLAIFTTLTKKKLKTKTTTLPLYKLQWNVTYSLADFMKTDDREEQPVIVRRNKSLETFDDSSKFFLWTAITCRPSINGNLRWNRLLKLVR
ncbi:hypothetical protein DdX_14502 [Ditylenchus destructor]|uniref:Uncharacterized protein n=1 Tax=Ditylenchus destructor TaxID=166010 RepID=A0AAD4MX14_9BILA|nr:hypothetical protein DdX_14502 [Ditylenchus destructor]